MIYSKCDIPYKFITLIQLLITRGISSLVVSKYSSSEPPNNFGLPDIFIRPIRLRLGTFDFTKIFTGIDESLVNAFRKNSAFESSLAILDVHIMYPLIFCITNVRV